MENNNKVTVKIYGQEYTIAGGDSGDRILEVANHVDTMMNSIARGLPSMSVSSLAVLTALNLTNDYFEVREKKNELEITVTSLRKDAEHYIQLWEDAKSSFKQYKDDSQNSIEQIQELQRIFNLKNIELNKSRDTIAELEKKLAEAESRLNSSDKTGEASEKAASDLKEMRSKYESALAESSRLKVRIQELEAARSTESRDASEISEKYKELESSFFDIQMENLQLKNELDNLKRGR